MMRNAADEYGRVAACASTRSVPASSPPRSWKAIPRDSADLSRATSRTRRWSDVGHAGRRGPDLARFLIGPESRWITGQAINVDGGHSLRRGPDFGPFIEPMLGASVMQGARPED